MSAEDLERTRALAASMGAQPSRRVAALGLMFSDLLTELDAVTAERDLAAAELHRLCDAAEAHRCGEGVVDIVGSSPAHEYAGLIACECDESHGQLCTACVARAQAGAP